MATTFKILDELNSPLLSAETSEGKGLAKYLPGPVVELMAIVPAAKALSRPLSQAPTNPVALEFAVTPSLGGDGALTLDAGVRAGVGVYQADQLLFPADDVSDAVSVPSGTAYVSLGLGARVKVGAESKAGSLSAAFAAGTSMTVQYFQPFDVAAVDPGLGEALADAITHAVVPADVDDVTALPVGAYASVHGEGALQLSGSFELASLTNPLATPSLPILGSAKITAGASVAVGAELSLTGGYELRVTRVNPDLIRLSYHRRTGSTLTVDATTSLGVSAKIGDSEVLTKFFSAVSADPKADLEALINANVSDQHIEDMQKAIAFSVDRTVRIAAEMQFSSVRRHEALFAFEIVPSAVSQEARAAVREALGARLTAIQRLAASGQAGIRLVHTGMLRTRERRVSWRVNLFGILNVLNIAELIRHGTLSYDADTGDLNAADEISSKRILVKTEPLRSDGQKVRKLIFESVIVSAAYQASRVISNVSLTCTSSYAESRAKTAANDLREDFNAIIGLGLADARERDERIGQEHDFGPSTFSLECSFDQRASDALFIGPSGALPEAYYERIGRNAMLALIPAGDADRAHRRAAIEQDATWAAMKDAGPAVTRTQLTSQIGELRAAHIVADYLLIVWWADAMGRAAKALMEMRQFLGGRTAAQLMSNNDFRKKREKLQDALANVVKNSRAEFGDPWGVLALDGAANRAATAQATIVSQKLTTVFTERTASVRQLPSRARDLALAAAAPVESSRATPRPLTADEREALRRHAINLRMGALSTEGEIHTDEADVDRLFGELIPAEIEARKQAGKKMRLLFWAHGGLNSEREGLEGVLARVQFWRANGVYPVSFVWETGLRESLADIIKGLAGRRTLATRGIGEDLADEVIEALARQGGKAVWSQMKRSAEVSVVDGGGALVVAQRLRDLWNQHHQHMEIHAAGHSAGSIFHAHVLPALLGQKTAAGVPPIAVQSLHFLAPAATTALFKSKLQALVGADKGIRNLTMYTMLRSFEQDATTGPYHKSLLYLVSNAFETDRPTPILGLEESLRQDATLMRFFGIAGNQKRADLLFSKTTAQSPLRDRTESISHGGFDDDVSTMNAVVARILDVSNADEITGFFKKDMTVAAERAASVAETFAASTRHDEPATPSPVPVRKGSELRPVTVFPSAGQLRALCIGIDQYGPPNDLSGCVNDAITWQKALERRGFSVTLLKDQEATRDAILGELHTMVTQAQPGDVIVFQYAGHGTQVEDLDGEEEDALDEAFCPIDFVAGRFLIDDDIRTLVGALREAVNFTSFIDCCHSGTITRALMRGGRPGATVSPHSKARFIPFSRELSAKHREFRREAGPGILVGTPIPRSSVPGDFGASARGMLDVSFAACQPHEVAYETAGAGQFTTRAVPILSGPAELTNADFIARVTAAFGANAPQHPLLDCAEAARERGLLQPLGVGV